MFLHLVSFLLVSYMRSYRYFPPLLGFLVGLMLLYASRPNPVTESYAASSILVYVVSAWIGASFLGAAGTAQEQIAAVHAGSVRKYLIGKAAAIFVCGILCSAAALVYPMAAGSFDDRVQAGEWQAALLAHIGLSLAGALAALLLGRPMIRNGSLAVASLLLVLILSIARNGILAEIGSGFAPLFLLLPPVVPLIERLTDPEAFTAGETAAVWIGCLVYCGLLYALYLRLAEKRM